MSYTSAISWLVKQGIKYPSVDVDGNVIKDQEGNLVIVDHVLGDDIAETVERQMMDIIVQPLFLFGFLKEVKCSI